MKYRPDYNQTNESQTHQNYPNTWSFIRGALLWSIITATALIGSLVLFWPEVRTTLDKLLGPLSEVSAIDPGAQIESDTVSYASTEAVHFRNTALSSISIEGVHVSKETCTGDDWCESRIEAPKGAFATWCAHSDFTSGECVYSAWLMQQDDSASYRVLIPISKQGDASNIRWDKNPDLPKKGIVGDLKMF